MPKGRCMKKIITGLIFLGFLMVSPVRGTEVKIGGGMIFENSIPGVVAAVDIPIPHKPLAISLSADYFSGSGHTSVPFSVKGLFRTHLSPLVAAYLGAGGGVMYTKVDGSHTSGTSTSTSHLSAKAAVGTGSYSSTSGLVAAVGGLDIKVSPDMGFFVEVSLDRALVSGAKNEVAAKGGIFFGLGHHGQSETDVHH